MRKWLFGIDESGSKQTPVYGFGALMTKWDRRGDVHQHFREIVARHPRHKGEVKWTKVKDQGSYDLACDLVDYFFLRKWLAFHCMVVRRQLIKRELHKDYDEAWRKNLCLFLVNKARLCAKRLPDDEHVVHVWADKIPSKYRKAAEALDIIGNRKLGASPVELKVFEHDSKEQPIIQLCDLLLGAVVQSWAPEPARGCKAALQQRIANYLGWEELRHGTFGGQKKFNIWHLHDHGAGRRVRGRRVILPERGAIRWV